MVKLQLVNTSSPLHRDLQRYLLSHSELSLDVIPKSGSFSSSCQLRPPPFPPPEQCIMKDECGLRRTINTQTKHDQTAAGLFYDCSLVSNQSVLFTRVDSVCPGGRGGHGGLRDMPGSCPHFIMNQVAK